MAAHVSKRARPSASAGVPDVRAEFFTLAGLAAASGLGIGIGEKAYQFIKSPDPLVVQVLDSKPAGSVHRVEFHAVNQTIHGIYIEGISLARPKVAITDVLLKERVAGSGLNFSSIAWVSKGVSAAFPRLVAPGDLLPFAIEFSIQNRQQYEQKPYGIAKIVSSRLEEKKPADIETTFRLRW